jgi:hypothetical protein
LCSFTFPKLLMFTIALKQVCSLLYDLPESAGFFRGFNELAFRQN